MCLLWLGRLPKEKQKSYKKLREEFLQAFDENKPEFYKLALTKAPKQRERETVKQYYRRFYKTFSRMVDDERLTTDFVRGLLPKYKIHMLQSSTNLKDISSAMKIASKWEQILLDQGSASDQAATLRSDYRWGDEDTQIINSMQSTQNHQFRNQGAHTNMSRACFQCGSFNHFIRNCPQNSNQGFGRERESQGNYAGREARCYTCNEGHYTSAHMMHNSMSNCKLSNRFHKESRWMSKD